MLREMIAVCSRVKGIRDMRNTDRPDYIAPLRWAALPILCLLLAQSPTFIAAAAEPADLSVVSFNIRYGRADDGDDSWPYRKDLVAGTLADRRPDVFGVQECLGEQAAFLQEAFPDYRMTGVGRDDGAQEGEMCALFTRKGRFTVLDQGTFWLSEAPDEVASRGWDAALPRICTWVMLADRAGRPDTLFVFNAHFDHVGEVARTESAALLHNRVASITAGRPAIVMGDFNARAAEDSAPYLNLTAPGEDGDHPFLVDSWAWAYGDEREHGEGTFHGFKGRVSRGRIDWILATGDFEGLDAGIDRRHEGGRYPSDHFPVWAVLRLESGAADEGAPGRLPAPELQR